MGPSHARANTPAERSCHQRSLASASEQGNFMRRILNLLTDPWVVSPVRQGWAESAQ